MESKIIVICGPTATGKSGLAVKLAKEFNGEIISADSRQIYREMNIGTGKDLGKSSKFKVQSSKFGELINDLQVGYYEIEGVKTWLYDIVAPSQRFSVAEYVPLAKAVISDVTRRGKLPLLVGGTGLYIDSLFKKAETFGIPPNMKLRAELETQSVEELVQRLEKLKPEKLKSMNNSDRVNPRRLIRAIEVLMDGGRGRNGGVVSVSDILMPIYIGLTASLPCLYKIIDDRVERMLVAGLLTEVGALAKKYGWTAPGLNGIGYRQFQAYFEKKDRLEDCVAKVKFATHAYARRQLTWFKKNSAISWFDVNEKDFDDRVSQLVQSNR